MVTITVEVMIVYCQECGARNEDETSICKECNSFLVKERSGGLFGNQDFASCSDQTIGKIVLIVGIIMGLAAIIPFFILETKELITLGRMRLIVSLPLGLIGILLIVIGGGIYYGCHRRNSILHNIQDDYRNKMENVSFGIFTIDRGGRFTYLNKSALELSGYTKDELVGSNFLMVIAPEYRETTIENFGKRKTGEASDRYEIEMLTKNGTIKRVELTLKTLEHKGEFMGVEGVAREVIN